MNAPSLATGSAGARPSILILIALAAVSPLGINMYLPSMPGMARSFGVDFATVQLTLSLYFAAVACGQLVVGPLSDRFGRRPVVLAGLALFVTGSLICLAAPTIWILIAGRVIQALGGCAGLALSRAIVRDIYPRDEAASMLGYVIMGMAIAPMIAPSIGGLLDVLYGWQATFAFLALFGGAVLVFALTTLHETAPARSGSPDTGALIRSYRLLVASPAFWGYTLTIAFSSAVFFAFLSGASYVMVDILGRSPAEYGLYFVVVSGGYVVGNFTSGRFARHLGPHRMMLGGVLLSLASVAVMAGAFAAGWIAPLTLFGPMFFVGAGNGFVMPNGIAGAVSVRPEVAGAAAGLSGSFQIGGGALVTPVVGALLDDSVWPLVGVMATCALLALATLCLLRRRPPPAPPARSVSPPA